MGGPNIDFGNEILQHCGGRLTVEDANMLYAHAMEIKAKNMLEIGSADGCSTMVLGMVAMKTGGKLQCLDPSPRGKWKWNVERRGIQDFVEMIPMASPWVPTEKIRSPIDFLFIDGDHRARWTIVDYHYWQHYVRIGGRIAFHDWEDRHEAGKNVREAVAIILRDDADRVLKKVGETRMISKGRGTVVFEKIGDGA